MLKNLKILDFSYLVPGPFATMILGDLGAEIINFKKEDENENDFDRYLARNKQQKSINLKEPTAIEYVKSLIQEYDIIIEQFRPGVMDKLGLGYEELKKINPQLIYCSITGYGQTGAYAAKGGHDINYLALAGVPSYSGAKSNKPPNMGIQIADLAGGSMYAVTGILAAVNNRTQTGEGQYLDVSMTDCTASFNVIAYANYFENNVVPSPESMPLNGAIFYDYYETKDGRYFSVGSLEPKFLSALLNTFGLSQRYFSKAYSRDPKLNAEFKQILKEQFLLYSFEDLVELFESTDACVEPVLTISEMEQARYFKERELFITKNVDGKEYRFAGHPIKYSNFKPKYQFIK